MDAPGRVITTACEATTSSCNRNSVYDEFLYHWVSAIVGETPEGMPVGADSNDDGYISMEEAYLCALWNDSMPEIPQYLSNPENLGTFLDLSGLDACTQTTVANQEIATDRDLEDCSIVIRNTSVKDGAKLILNYGLHVSVEAGFEMEEGAELEISPSGR